MSAGGQRFAGVGTNYLKVHLKREQDTFEQCVLHDIDAKVADGKTEAIAAPKPH